MVTRLTQHKGNVREFLCIQQAPGRDLSEAMALVIPLATVRPQSPSGLDGLEKVATARWQRRRTS